MNELQQRLCNILFWFHDFCECESLTYYASYGTLLGAVRHKGFIPWDDDIDVCMPRKDYEKCKKIFESSNNQIDNYFLEHPHMEAKDYIYTYCKLYDTKTTLIEPKRRKCRRGVFLDIFPLDGAGQKMEDGIAYYKTINYYKNLLNAISWAFDKRNRLIVNLAIFFARLIPSFIVEDKTLARKIDLMAQQRGYDLYGYVGNLVGPYKTKEIIEKKIFGKPSLYCFEGRQIYGPECYDEYLTHIYGNWRELPPKEKQRTEHNFCFLDLNHSFLSNNVKKSEVCLNENHDSC